MWSVSSPYPTNSRVLPPEVPESQQYQPEELNKPTGSSRNWQVWWLIKINVTSRPSSQTSHIIPHLCLLLPLSLHSSTHRQWFSSWKDDHVDKQVQRLIEQATSHENLCQCLVIRLVYRDLYCTGVYWETKATALLSFPHCWLHPFTSLSGIFC